MMGKTLFARHVAALTALAALVCAGTAQADITATGAATIIAPPASVQAGALESNSQIFVFEERHNFALPVNVQVDITEEGRLYSDATGDSTGVIAAGTLVNSHFVHMDPVGNAGSGGRKLTGSITFDNEIIGIIVRDELLNDTDTVLGAAGTTYPTGLSGRGSVFGETVDELAFFTTRTDAGWVLFVEGNSIDQLRILTRAGEVIPLPAASWMGISLLGGLGLLSATRRRRENSV